MPRKFHGTPIGLASEAALQVSGSEAVLNDCGEFRHTIVDLLLVNAAVTEDQSPSLRVSLTTDR